MNLDSIISELAGKFFGYNQSPSYDFGFEQLQQRNEIRRQEAIKQLGDKWLLHPSHTITKSERTQ